MPVQPVQRKLAAIFAADIAGYSRLMARDEVGTLARLKACRAIVDRLIETHRGRIFTTAGDSVVADFASAVDAVQCAVTVQASLKERIVPAAGEPMLLRIGIHVGDVVVDGTNLLGDGVNVAARLEAMAAPGGICCSGTVHDQIRDKLPYPFHDWGEQSVKNIARPVRVYSLSADAVAILPALSTPPAAPISLPAVAPRLSIVVLPFANLSDDQEQQYFADGITEDLTTDLSRIEGSFVISRNTAFTYRGTPVDTRQIGRELGVRYVLEGSVRRSGNQIRVNAQLIDAETDAHLWAERFDRDARDLFALQDEITSRIAVTLSLELVAVEAARPTEHPEAMDYILRGRAVRAKGPSRENYSEAFSLFERALTLDPLSVNAKGYLALTLVNRALDNLTHSSGTDIARAEGLIGEVLAASPHSTLAHFVKGQLLRAQRRSEEAIPEYELVLARDRNSADALVNLGKGKLFIGSMDEAIALLEQAVRLNPRDPYIGNSYYWIGQVHLLESRTDKALVWFERARSAGPELPHVHANLASAVALKGDTERAAVELAEARRLSSDDRYSSIARLRAAGTVYFGVPKVHALYETTYFAGLRKAGMPEE